MCCRPRDRRRFAQTVLLVAACALAAGPLRSDPSCQDVADLLARYNARIARTLQDIETLTVEQDMVEPQDDGSPKRAHAVLSYERGAGLTREETFSDLRYPAGEYTLESLVGPALDPAEYSVTLEASEEMNGHACCRLSVKAVKRDAKHIDGVVWISAQAAAPVRIKATVADPPFPASEIRLDKSFEPDASGPWLLRSHVGEAEVRLLWTKKSGTRRISYDQYLVKMAEP